MHLSSVCLSNVRLKKVEASELSNWKKELSNLEKELWNLEKELSNLEKELSKWQKEQNDRSNCKNDRKSCQNDKKNCQTVRSSCQNDKNRQNVRESQNIHKKSIKNEINLVNFWFWHMKNAQSSLAIFLEDFYFLVYQ